MTIDRERTATYAAEDDAFEGTDLADRARLADLADLAERVVTDPWWPGPPVVVRAARADSSTSSARCGAEHGGDVEIRLASTGCTVATLVHELAHAVAGPGRGHDEVFRRATLDVLAVTTNVDLTSRRGDRHVVALHAAFDAHSLAVGERSWPDPVGFGSRPGAGGASIAL
ncbi:MAG: hypothetical protein AAFY28_21895 [Actinomycetota bacterium]